MRFPLPLALIALVPLAALAQPAPQPPFQNVVTLDASATAEVPVDTLTITLFTEEQGPDAAELAARANTRLEQALATAKAAAGVEARSGAYQTTPSYDRAGQINGWRLRAEIVVESRDFKAASALAGRLQPALKLGAMTFSLSRPAREKAEATLLTQALHNYQARAEAIAKALGFPGYTLGQIAVRSDYPQVHPVQFRAMAVAMADGGAAPPPPIEGGTNAVTVTVSGSVILGPAR
jgi:predicted secreted protein